MGKGNWVPSRPARHDNQDTFSDQVYLDLTPPSNVEGQECTSLDIFDEIENVKLIVGENLWSTLSTDKHPLSLDLARHDRCLFWNRHFLVLSDEDSEHWHYGIGIVVNPQAYHYGYGGLAERSAQRAFERMKEALRKRYPVRVRTSAWTSAQLPNSTKVSV